MQLNIIETLQYVKKFSGMRLLIKLGGSILHDRQLLKDLCLDLGMLYAAGMKPIIVHGGGTAINIALEKLNTEYTFKQGLRITDEKMMEVIEPTLMGVNQSLVRELNANGANAVGLSGCSDHIFECEPFSIEHDRVGNIIKTNIDLIEHLFCHTSQKPYTPVIAPIGSDRQGKAYNINADWAASRLAIALHADKLIYITDQNGILDPSGQQLSKLDAHDLKRLIKNKTVTDGMLTKTKTVLNTLNHGIDNVHIINGKHAHTILKELFTDSGVGTLCTSATKPPTLNKQAL